MKLIFYILIVMLGFNLWYLHARVQCSCTCFKCFPKGSSQIFRYYFENLSELHFIKCNSIFYKHTGKLVWSLICLRFSQFKPEIMLDGMLNFKTNFIVWYCVWYEHCSGLFQMFEFEHSSEFDMNTAIVSSLFEILWVA